MGTSKINYSKGGINRYQVMISCILCIFDELLTLFSCGGYISDIGDEYISEHNGESTIFGDQLMRSKEDIQKKYKLSLSELNSFDRMSDDWYELRIAIDELEWVLEVKL